MAETSNQVAQRLFKKIDTTPEQLLFATILHTLTSKLQEDTHEALDGIVFTDLAMDAAMSSQLTPLERAIVNEYRDSFRSCFVWNVQTQAELWSQRSMQIFGTHSLEAVHQTKLLLIACLHGGDTGLRQLLPDIPMDELQSFFNFESKRMHDMYMDLMAWASRRDQAAAELAENPVHPLDPTCLQECLTNGHKWDPDPFVVIGHRQCSHCGYREDHHYELPPAPEPAATPASTHLVSEEGEVISC